MTGPISSSLTASSGRSRLPGSHEVLDGIRLETLPYRDDTVRWPLWKTALFVLTVSGGFWGGIIYTAVRSFN